MLTSSLGEAVVGRASSGECDVLLCRMCDAGIQLLFCTVAIVRVGVFVYGLEVLCFFFLC